MAGRGGLKVLLLWAGIIGLSKSQAPNPTATSPPRTTAATTALSSDTSTHKPPLTPASFSSNQTNNSSTVSATSPPRTTAATTALSSDTSTHKLPLTTPNPASFSSNRTNNSSTVSATIPSTSRTNSNQTISQNATSPPDTQLSTTTTQAAPTGAPSLCSYSVTPIKFGFRIEFSNSPSGDYNIAITEDGRPDIKNTSNVPVSNQTSSHDIQGLKPCTEYKHHVTFLHSDGNVTSCSGSNYKSTTTEMNAGDVKEVNSKPGHVCYQTDWDISSLQSTQSNISPQSHGNKTFCVKPDFNDICSDLVFTSKNCVNAAFTLTKYITAEFLNPEEIKQIPADKLPAEIKAELPPNCNNLSINYTCWEDGRDNELKTLSELEPFTDYSCTGQIKDNNVLIKNTSALHFRVDCDLTITVTKSSPTNTSVELIWKTTSQKCEDDNLENLSYFCSYENAHRTLGTKLRSGGKCNISGLKPFTKYKCKVQPTYKHQPLKDVTHQDIKTDVGVPGPVTMSLQLQEHNVIKVTCETLQFNGPEKIYMLQVSYGSEIVRNEQRINKCNFVFDNLRYSTTYKVKVTAFNGKLESAPKIESITTNYNDKAVIGFLIFLIVLTSLALLLVTYKIYILKKRRTRDMGENVELIQPTNEEENLLRIEPIPAELLLEAYKRKLADEGRLFLDEFQSIPRIFSRYSVREAKKTCNVPKNRYVDILPYDYNRVQLTTGSGEAGCDYINASFIDGYKEPKKYIAAQGPKEDTVTDFWRMIWEQQSSIIVMVTRCEEGNRVKCAQYWPSPQRETEIYNEFVVKLNSEEHCPDYTIRHLCLINKREKSSEREVTHIQFMSWPDHGVPDEPHLLLKLRRRVNAFKNFFSGPIVVHCSAGVGRTGTYIAIDAMMEGLEAEGRVDIYGYIVQLRRHRCLMVQVEAQYILIHQALLEHNQFGETELMLSELHTTLNTLKQKSSDSDFTLMQEEFERLPTYKNWRTINTGITEENKGKNRSLSVVPYDYNRVLLKLDEGCSRDSDPNEEEGESSGDEDEDEDSGRYINASYISGYWGPHAIIAAQTPLTHTMADFWLTVYQKKASTIVMLSEEDKESVYWNDGKKTFEDIEVEVTSTETTSAFITRDMLIRHVKRKEGRTVRQLQFLKWVNSELPETPQDLTGVIKEIKSSCGSNRSQTIVVHCNDGSSRTGIFCALWSLLDSAKTEKVVDVFQVVKTLRKERQNMISSLEQYQFLYDTVQSVFPVQNGDVKAPQAPAADCMQIVNETKAAAEKADEPAGSTTSTDQQGAADGDKKEEAEGESTGPTETMEDTPNGPNVPLVV
ncbi:receptor-type tyrosine-protein phosphatase C isoform X1 [Solea senegalensis]|uniref:Receptor-type tyrosine-protein phosphatase C n=1 Tax=Solea senegalensis TaxID=28829 RepID=A0AAV6SCY4_SOLSE|nr:receptor-type tyrosine-protein phosphatase C isoform X5 [Solea senegalensis]KAG7514880.1 receptor-type tyrosine-protein phosphatase C isoform X1 [Solea senegalensis]